MENNDITNDQLNTKVFGDKSFSDLLKHVYDNNVEFDDQIDGLIQEISPLIKSINDAAMLAPIITDYLNSKIKNNDILVKMTAIVQRAIQTSQAKVQGEEVGFEDIGFSMDDLDQVSFEITEQNKIKDKTKEIQEKKETVMCNLKN